MPLAAQARGKQNSYTAARCGGLESSDASHRDAALDEENSEQGQAEAGTTGPFPEPGEQRCSFSTRSSRGGVGFRLVRSDSLGR